MTSQKTLALVQSLVVTKLGCIRCPTEGIPYGVLVGNGPDGKEYTALACGSKIDLDKLDHLIGLTINVDPTPNGLKVKPFAQQPEETIQQLFSRLESWETPTIEPLPEPVDLTSKIADVVIMVAEQAVAKGIPIAAWCCIPN